jgi:hypothetical protein
MLNFLPHKRYVVYAMHYHVKDLFKNKMDIILSPATQCTVPMMRDDVASHGESNLSETSALMRYMIHGNLTIAYEYDDETSLPISLQITDTGSTLERGTVVSCCDTIKAVVVCR